MNLHQFPQPAAAWLQMSTGSEAPPNGLASAAAQWKPLFADAGDVVTHFAHRLIDRTSGMPYSADELETKIIGLLAPYDGEPSNYVAEVPPGPMTATYAADTGKTIALTARTAGVQDPAPALDIIAPVATSAGANAAIAIVSETGGTVTVRPGTGAGDQAHAHIETAGTDQLTVTCAVIATAIGPDGNDKRILVTQGVVGKADATATYVSPTITVDLALAAGTAAVWTLTDAGTGANSLVTLTAPVGEGMNPTTWNAYTFTSIVPAAVSQSLTIDVSAAPAIVIKLGTAANGDVVTSTSIQVAAAIKTALDTLTGKTWQAVGAVAAGVWNSFNAAQSASTAGVLGTALTTSKNQTTAIATLIHAIGGGAGGTVFSCTNTGTHVVTVADNVALISFTGGGANSAIDSNLTELASLLANSTVMSGVVGDGDGDTLITDSTTTLTGGSDLVPATLGTPAALGRLAVGFETGEETVKSVWTAFTDDPTTTQAGWVKTFTGS